MAKKITVLAEYLEFIDIFLKESAIELFERSDIYEHSINPKLGKQPLYALIYSLELMKLETLKTYIKTNLVNNFIRLSKSPAGTPMQFVQKLNDNFRLDINY